SLSRPPHGRVELPVVRYVGARLVDPFPCDVEEDRLEARLLHVDASDRLRLERREDLREDLLRGGDPEDPRLPLAADLGAARDRTELGLVHGLARLERDEVRLSAGPWGGGASR